MPLDTMRQAEHSSGATCRAEQIHVMDVAIATFCSRSALPQRCPGDTQNPPCGKRMRHFPTLSAAMPQLPPYDCGADCR